MLGQSVIVKESEVKELESILGKLYCACDDIEGIERAVYDHGMLILENYCEHWWVEKDDELGGDRSTVQCSKCKVSGERNNKTGEVFYPIT